MNVLQTNPHGAIVLSLYDGFFMGGSRVVHTELLRSLSFTTDHRHSVLSLTNRVRREYTLQKVEETIPYRRLVQAGIAVNALDREPSSPWLSADLTLLEQLVKGSEVLMSLKEQPLPALQTVGTHGKPLFVSLHRSDPENQGEGTQDLLTMVERGEVTKAICCAHAAKDAYRAVGVPEDRLTVIPNGVDLNRFRRDPQVRSLTREQLHIPHEVPVILLAARFDAMKNIPLFFETVAQFLKLEPRAHFIVCGAGMTKANDAFSELASRFLTMAQQERIVALGIQSSMMPLYNATDLVVLTSSFGEAAPLCLLEGMAVGAIPVTTAVGDSALIVGDERLVAPSDARLMARSWADAHALRHQHRSRIFSQRQKLSDQHGFDAYHRLIQESLK